MAEQLSTVLSKFVEQQAELLEKFNGLVLHEEKSKQSEQTEQPNVLTSLNFDTFQDELEDFSSYRQRLENFFELKNITGNEDDVQRTKARILINCIGAKHYQLLVSLVSPDIPANKSYNELIKLVEKHLCPKPNVFVQQHSFLSRVQGPTENISEFIAGLRKLTFSCEFKCGNCDSSVADTFLRAQFIRGLRDESISEKILQQPELSFEGACDLALALDASKKGSKTFHEAEVVNKVSKINKGKNHNPIDPPVTQRDTRHGFYERLGIAGLCLRCGKDNHSTKFCNRSVNTMYCSLCRKRGHVARVCITTISKSNQHKVNAVNLNEEIQYDEGDLENKEDLEFSVRQIVTICNTSTSTTSYEQKFTATLKVGNGLLKFEIDTGSPVTIINNSDFQRLCPGKSLKPSTVKFRTVTGEIFEPLGFEQVDVRYNNQLFNQKLFVVEHGLNPLLGRDWLKQLKIPLVSEESINNLSTDRTTSKLREKVLNEFSGLFEEKIGEAPYCCSLNLKDNAHPVFLKPRVVPFALRDKVEAELDRLESENIIEKVDNAQWGSPLVVVPKPDGNVRLCFDYKCTINSQLKDTRYPIPVIDEVLGKIRGGKVFCVLDIHKAYLHIPVDEESQKLQAISTHRGTYVMKRLSFGIKTAPSEFAKFIDTVLKGLECTLAYFDDIIIWGSNIEECYNRLIACLSRLEKFNLHINKNKSKFFEDEITYLGHKISKQGIQKSPDKVKAILDAPSPTNLDEVRTFIGYVSYYSKFIPNVASIMYPVYQLLKKGNRPFRWTEACERAATKIKAAIASDVVLVGYDPSLPLVLATDASPVGISAILSHVIDGTERPIFFASRSLTPSEKNYSQIDREATAIYWAFMKFYPYIYGRKFSLVTDNKPLTHIFNSNSKLPVITASRLLRYAMFLSGFDFEIIFRRSSDHGNADYLSRFPLPSMQTSVDENYTVCNLTLASISNEIITQKNVLEETDKDPELISLKRSLQNGTCTSLEYSLHEGIIFRGERVVIPKSLQQYVLRELHKTHQGIVRMKSLARRYCYWKLIDKDIEAVAKSCKACSDLKNNQMKVPAHPWEPPKGNWERVHIDYAGPFLGHHFLIVVDSLSKWPEVAISKSSPTTESTIVHLREIFSRNGLPVAMVSDNASIFTSENFQAFLHRNGIEHKTIAPGHPATNGQAERFVQSFKNKLKAVVSDPGTLHAKVHEALFYYRATPFGNDDKSPAENFMQRRFRTRLDLLKLKPSQGNKSHSKPFQQLPQSLQLCLGDRVQAKYHSPGINTAKWKYGYVVKVLGRLHYLVKLDEGMVVKRHIEQLRKSEVNIPHPSHSNQPHLSVPLDSVIKPCNHRGNGNSFLEIQRRSLPTPILRNDQDATNNAAPLQEAMQQVQEDPRPNSPIKLRRSTRVRRPVVKLNL